MTKKKTKSRPIAVIDAETDPFKYGRVPEPFLWGFYNGKEFIHWETREEMMAYLADKEYIIYAHNGGRFDWHYLKGFIPVPSEIMLINGRISKFTIGRCEFRDSFNMVPVALKAYDKDTINYEIMEKEVRKLPKNWDEIMSYLRKDCVSLYEMVTRFIDMYGLHLTQAGASMKSWEKMGERKAPRTDEHFYQLLRPYYRGGRVEAFEHGDISTLFTVYDINSAYPFAMLQEHPISETPEIDQSGAMPEGNYGPQFFTILARSRGALPCFFDDDGIEKTIYPDDDEVREYHTTGWEVMAGLETGTLEIVKVKERIYFSRHISFADYILYFYDLRQRAKKEGDKLMDLFAKLQMNSLYGKFAADPEAYDRYRLVSMDEAIAHHQGSLTRAGLVPRGADMSELYDDGGFEEWAFAGPFYDGTGIIARSLNSEERRYYNVATGASITGFVRAMLWRAICKAGRELVLYCDTDSIAVRGTKHEISLSGDLGAWKNEGLFDRAIILRRKTYAFRRDHADYLARKKEDKKITRWKTAHKGLAEVTPSQMAKVARGEVIRVHSQSPVYSAYGSPKFQPRTLQRDF